MENRGPRKDLSLKYFLRTWMLVSSGAAVLQAVELLFSPPKSFSSLLISPGSLSPPPPYMPFLDDPHFLRLSLSTRTEV